MMARNDGDLYENDRDKTLEERVMLYDIVENSWKTNRETFEVRVGWGWLGRA